MEISFEIDHHLYCSLCWWDVHSLTPLFFEELTWLVNKVSLIVCLMHHLESIAYILEWCTSLTSSARCEDHWLAGWMNSPSCLIVWLTCLSTLLEWYLTAFAPMIKGVREATCILLRKTFSLKGKRSWVNKKISFERKKRYCSYSLYGLINLIFTVSIKTPFLILTVLLSFICLMT